MLKITSSSPYKLGSGKEMLIFWILCAAYLDVAKKPLFSC